MPTELDLLRAAVAAGARPFDAGRFFEAHEVWEEAWRGASGAPRLVLQGLVQIAAGFHKGLVQGRPAGMATLLARGLGRIAEAGDPGPLPLGELCADAERWREAALGWARGGPRPSLALPRIGLSRTPRDELG